MDLLANLALGMGVALTPEHLGYALIGAFLGTLVGVLPGLGPVATIAMLLPITFGMTPIAALIMLAGIYYGAQYGGSTTAILVNLPGESSSVVTTLDGYQMARQGRAGPALGAAALASFFAGCVATLLVAVFAKPLANIALSFGPAEYFALMVLGLVAAVVIAAGSLLNAVAMTVLGLLLSMIGTDINSGTTRFAFGINELADGIGFVVVAMGMFGVAEVIANTETQGARAVFNARVGKLMPGRAELLQIWKPTLRGTALGSALGILPGGGPILASFAAYTFEKRIARDPTRFGKGAIEGVAAPEAANNAGAQTSFVPLLTLGIPGNPVMALMIGAMMLHGVTPGPQVMNQKPELFWGVIASMWVGNLMLIVLNMPLIGLWVKLLSMPYRWLYPAILLFCCIGIFSLSNNASDVVLLALFGLLGWVLMKLGCEPAPLILGFVLGPMMEEYLRRALLISRGDWTVFLTRPICLVMLIAAVVLIAVVLFPAIGRRREEALRG